MHHTIKTVPVAFEAVWQRRKTFEVRVNDRMFQTGDTVTLREFDFRAACTCEKQGRHCTVDCGRYSGREITATVGFILGSFPGRGSGRGFNGGDYVVFSLCDPANVDGRRPVTAAAEIARHIAKATRIEVL